MFNKKNDICKILTYMCIKHNKFLVRTLIIKTRCIITNNIIRTTNIIIT